MTRTVIWIFVSYLIDTAFDLWALRVRQVQIYAQQIRCWSGWKFFETEWSKICALIFFKSWAHFHWNWFLNKFTRNLQPITLVHGNKAKLKGPSLALLRCKQTLEIFELGLIAVQNGFSNFRAWPYCGAKWLSKFSGLALLRCKSAWPYCRAPV